MLLAVIEMYYKSISTPTGTPIAVSKHLVVPQAQNGNSSNRENYGSKTPTKVL